MEAEGVSRQPQVKGETHIGSHLPGGRRRWGGGDGEEARVFRAVGNPLG